METKQVDVVVTLLIRIREMLGSETGYRDAFRGFPQLFQANTGTEPEIGRWPVLFTFFPILYLLSSNHPTPYSLCY
jgi:hypothetical protein